MSKTIRLNEAETSFIMQYINSQIRRAQTDPDRGVLARHALEKLKKKLESGQMKEMTREVK